MYLEDRTVSGRVSCLHTTILESSMHEVMCIQWVLQRCIIVIFSSCCCKTTCCWASGCHCYLNSSLRCCCCWVSACCLPTMCVCSGEATIVGHGGSRKVSLPHPLLHPRLHSGSGGIRHHKLVLTSILWGETCIDHCIIIINVY